MPSTMAEIHDSLRDGLRTQMVDQINEHPLYDFWAEYVDYLEENYTDYEYEERYNILVDTIISYHRIMSVRACKQ